MKYYPNPGRLLSRLLRLLGLEKKVPHMAFGSWVDDYGAFYGVKRKLFETDPRYINRIVAHVMVEHELDNTGLLLDISSGSKEAFEEIQNKLRFEIMINKEN